MSKYQIMPPLSEDQFEALKADISTAGIRVPIEVDENGEVIDGHHRRAIAMELGIECPETVIRGLEEFEKLDRAFVLNATRRHFDREQRRAVVVKSLMLHPRLADREHARRCGVSHPTVSGVRAALEAAGRLESFTSRVSGDGRERPAHNEPTRSAPSTQQTAAGNANAPADGENPTAFQGSPATGAGASEADRPAPVVTPTDHPAAPGEADEDRDSSSAADVTTPSANQTGPEVPSSKAPAGPVDGREQPDPAGVSGSAAPVPAKPFEFPDVDELRQRADLDPAAVEEYARATEAHALAQWRDDLTTVFVNFRKAFRAVTAQDIYEKADDELVNLIVNTSADIEEKWAAVAELKVAASKSNVVQLRSVS